jgi:hypothetical protein
VDYAVRNTRALARSAIELLATGRPAPIALVISARELAQAVRVFGGQLIADEPRTGARWPALTAAAQAMGALNDNNELAIAMVVGQVRSTALDLLRGTGMDVTTAEQALDEFAGPTIEKS